LASDGLWSGDQQDVVLRLEKKKELGKPLSV
jgi:hypothetical protein